MGRTKAPTPARTPEPIDEDDQEEVRIGHRIRDPDVLALMEAFRKAGDFISHDALDAVIRDHKRANYYNLVHRALSALVYEGIIFECERGKGYRREDTSGTVRSNDKYRVRNVRNSNRGLRRLRHAVWGKNLSQEDAWNAAAQQCIFDQTSRLNGKRSVENLKTIAASTVHQDQGALISAMQAAVGGINQRSREKARR